MIVSKRAVAHSDATVPCMHNSSTACMIVCKVAIANCNADTRHSTNNSSTATSFGHIHTEGAIIHSDAAAISMHHSSRCQCLISIENSGVHSDAALKIHKNNSTIRCFILFIIASVYSELASIICSDYSTLLPCRSYTSGIVPEHIVGINESSLKQNNGSTTSFSGVIHECAVSNDKSATTTNEYSSTMTVIISLMNTRTRDKYNSNLTTPSPAATRGTIVHKYAITDGNVGSHLREDGSTTLGRVAIKVTVHNANVATVNEKHSTNFCIEILRYELDLM